MEMNELNAVICGALILLESTYRIPKKEAKILLAEILSSTDVLNEVLKKGDYIMEERMLELMREQAEMAIKIRDSIKSIDIYGELEEVKQKAKEIIEDIDYTASITLELMKFGFITEHAEDALASLKQMREELLKLA